MANSITYISYGLIMLGALGAILSSMSTNRQGEEIKDLNFQIKEKTKENKGLIENLKYKAEENKQINDQLKKISENIQSLSISIEKTVSDLEARNRMKGTLKLKLEPNSKYTVVIGTNYVIFNKSQMEKGVVLIRKVENTDDKENNLLSVRLKDNSLLVNAKFYDLHGNLVGEINESKWGINKQIYSSINYDQKALEVLDNRGNVALQLILDDKTLVPKGIFQYDRNYLIVDDRGLQTVEVSDPNVDNMIRNYSKSIERVFEHTGIDYLGKRITNNDLKDYSKTVKNLSNKQLLEKGKEKKELLDFVVQKIDKINEDLVKNMRSGSKEAQEIFRDSLHKVIQDFKKEIKPELMEIHKRMFHIIYPDKSFEKINFHYDLPVAKISAMLLQDNLKSLINILEKKV